MKKFLSIFCATILLSSQVQAASGLSIGVDMLTGPKGRSEEDMSELTREVAKGNKMAKGGMTASKRGDGIAQRGKTRGKMC